MQLISPMRAPSKHPITGMAMRFAFFLFLIFFAVGAKAQLVADFSADQQAGCAPLTVLFNNKTAGASPNARYFWDFDNGNTSALHSPGAVFRAEKTYTVTLTVTDGSLTATKSVAITVYKKPVVDFSASLSKGCLPLPVHFTGNIDPGDGAIANITWDFGNGNVVQGNDKASLTHTFQFAQKPSVGLTVTNSNGCFTTVEKTQLLEVFPQVKAGFTFNKKALCVTGDSVQFQNTSVGSGALVYQWRFGDGGTATQPSPRHRYDRAGGFDVSLKVTNSEGCSDSLVLPALVNVANFNAGIQTPSVICAGAPATFQALTSPMPDSIKWNLGSGLQSLVGSSINPVFANAGTRNIGLTAYWGACTVTATEVVAVHQKPVLSGFVQPLSAQCGLPYAVAVKDTTQTAAAWRWEVAGQEAQATKNALFSFTNYGQYPLTLTVTDTLGCAASITRNLAVINPRVAIKVLGTSSQYGASGCTGLTLKFGVESTVSLISYRWAFGDGGTDSTASPEYVFSRPGRYNVVLHYVTASGCADSAVFSDVAVYSKPSVDFTGPSEICSSNPVGFEATSDTAVRKYYWNYGDGSPLDTVTTIHHYNEHKYMQEGTYTVTLIANGQGSCADTVSKTAFIKVNPPFQSIHNVFNDCTADRNRIFVQLNTRSVISGQWDWGDGTVVDKVPASFQIEPHSFAAPGLYKVKHSSVNGACTSVDSVLVPVPGKQSPRLTASRNFVCLDDTVTIHITGVQLLDLANYKNNPIQYRLQGLRYVDGSRFTGSIQVLDSNWATGFKAVLSGFGKSNMGLRAFIVSNITGCVDSSDILSITFSGPKAAIQPVAAACFTQDLLFRNASVGDIRSWQWQIGDQQMAARTASDTVQYRFAAPGVYPVSLKVTDADGCTNTTMLQGGVRVLGVKARFNLPDTVVAINTQVQFTNISTAISGATVRYQWRYSNGSRTAATTHLVHSYPDIGWDTVRLTARTVEGGCVDSVEQVLHHDNINAKFTYESAYINNNACPPMLVKFKNLSRNNRSTRWTFGDGSTALNQQNPERTYRVGGTFKVTLYTYGPGNQVDSATEYIQVKGPSASITADKYFGCLNQQVQLKATVAHAKDYYWDFGDGAVLRSRDTLAKHQYLTAGVYIPSLVLSDSTGCSVAAELGQPVIIDSLSLGIAGIPAQLCDAGLVQFKPRAVSLAVDKLGQSLAYRWTFGAASSTAAMPSRQYTGEGRYPISVTAVSPYGCVQTAIDTVIVRRTVKGTITGKPEICEGGRTAFSAAIPGTGSTWQWMMPDGSTANSLQSPVVSFADSGFYPVKLVVTHDGCVDTARQTLWVHANPKVRFANPDEFVCRGKTATLQASGGVHYRWRGTEPILLGAALDKPVVFPAQTTFFSVLVTSPFGCQSTDSMRVRVAQPFRMPALRDTFVCIGSEVALQASGAYSYLWSGPAGTLRSTTGPSNVAMPLASAQYQVIGTDSARCFSDTVYARVRLEPLPLVQAGPDQIVLTGTEVTLAAKTSDGIVRYAWLPKEGVQCSSCALTVASPRKPTAFTLTVTNQFGCVAADTVMISLECTESRVFIPNAFTPDADGLNETFSVRGRGASVKSMRIFDRWGKMVYEAGNLQLNDSKSGWDGTFNGQKAPTGTYVYVTELVCDTGEPFIRKGSVTLIR